MPVDPENNSDDTPGKEMSGTVAGFLAQVKQRKHLPERRSLKRLIFALDATASREPTWDLACSLHGELFLEVGNQAQLAVQLCYYRGLNEFTASPFSPTPEELLGQMQRVHCLAGRTQLERLLAHTLTTARNFPLRGLVFVGDAFEENLPRILQQAGELRLRNVPVFIFQEGSDPRAGEAFARIAATTGGGHVQFNSAGAEELKRLLGAIASFATAGREGLEHFARNSGSRKALQLLEQLDNP